LPISCPEESSHSLSLWERVRVRVDVNYQHPPQLIKNCRELRKNQTDVETRLWHRLRNKQMGGFRFRRQHLLGPYIIDFYCHEARLAIELDGGQHGEAEKGLYDRERTRFLEVRGIRVLRFWNNEVFHGLEGVLETIRLSLTPTLSQREREKKRGTL